MSKARDLANAGTALTTVSATELGYLDGVTSAVQTQIDSKIGQATAINPTIVDAKGDIIAATAADTVSKLSVGANGTTLVADSAEATGLKWATSSSGANWTLLNAGGTSLTGTSTSITGISGQDKLLILVKGASHSSAFDSQLVIQFNTNTSSVYTQQGFNVIGDSNTALTAGSLIGINSTQDGIRPTKTSANAGSVASAFCLITGCNSSGVKAYTASGGADNNTSTSNSLRSIGGIFDSSSTISSVQIKFDSVTFDAGTVFIYGSA